MEKQDGSSGIGGTWAEEQDTTEVHVEVNGPRASSRVQWWWCSEVTGMVDGRSRAGHCQGLDAAALSPWPRVKVRDDEEWKARSWTQGWTVGRLKQRDSLLMDGQG